MKQLHRWALVLATLCAFSLACGRGATTPPPSRPDLVYPVRVAPVAAQPVEYAVTAVGSVEAYERVPIIARVAGVVEHVAFTEGDYVARGQVLVDIELERYALAVKAAQAALERAQTAQAEAEAGVRRREGALAQTPGLIPGEELETWRNRVLTLAADVRQAHVAWEQAQLNLRDARVRAPAAGVVQTRDARTGQYVQPGALLASLVRRDPLLLKFAVTSADAAHLQPGMVARFRVREPSQDFEAKLIHVAAAADDATRMVAVTGRITGSVQALRPGAFAEIVIPVAANEPTPVIPQTAIRASERGMLAYVVTGDSKVAERRITTGLRTAHGQIEVREGLEPGETLVVRGMEALHDGATVRVVQDEAVPQKLELGQAEP